MLCWCLYFHCCLPCIVCCETIENNRRHNELVARMPPEPTLSDDDKKRGRFWLPIYSESRWDLYEPRQIDDSMVGRYPIDRLSETGRAVRVRSLFTRNVGTRDDLTETGRAHRHPSETAL